MLHEDADIRAFLANWKHEEPSAFLATRIVAHATALPQKQPWPQAIVTSFTQAFSQWNYALAYKTAALAACLVLGLFTAQDVTSNSDVAGGASVIGDMWTEEL